MERYEFRRLPFCDPVDVTRFMNELDEKGYEIVSLEPCTEGREYFAYYRKKDVAKLQHVYVFHDDEDGDIIADFWTCSVPDVGEYMILWDKNAHHHYEVSRRIYGANADEKVGTWNLYVKPKSNNINNQK